VNPPTPAKAHKPLSRPIVATGIAATVVIAAGAFVLSFSALTDLSVRAGINPALAWMWPIIVDGMIVAATVAIVALAGRGAREQAYPWVLLFFGAIVSTAANSVHAVLAVRAENGNVPVVVSALVAAMPPVVLLAITHLTVILVQNARPAAASSEPAASDAAREPAAAKPASRGSRRAAGSAASSSATGSAAEASAPVEPGAEKPAKPKAAAKPRKPRRAAGTASEASVPAVAGASASGAAATGPAATERPADEPSAAEPSAEAAAARQPARSGLGPSRPLAPGLSSFAGVSPLLRGPSAPTPASEESEPERREAEGSETERSEPVQSPELEDARA
jgi:hypothetical protein